MKGINFIEPLFHEVVSEQKTQTRRIINHIGNCYHYGKLLCDWALSEEPKEINPNEWKWILQTEVDDCAPFILRPRYKVGETVYLKEPYRIAEDGSIDYKYNHSIISEQYKEFVGGKWKNKLFMPAEYARYFIKITGVKAERLQDISEEDCLKEGCRNWRGRWRFAWQNEVYKTPREAYAALIDRINGKGTWDSNPFVYAYDFKLLK